MSEVAKYRLRSTELINTPGMLRWLKAVYATDKKTARFVMKEGYPALPAPVIEDFLSGKIEGTEVVEADGFVTVEVVA